MSEIKWAPIFPLVGGFPLGAEVATGTPPSYILSYDVAAFNDSFYNRYMNETRKLEIPFLRIDADDFNPEALPEIDIAVATPFCSGLSMLNSSASRGSDSEVNKWIYESTELCMKYTGAKVIIGENAPGLYSEMGEKLRDNLIKMANQYGYTTSFVKTSTIKHGIPQKRDRTFYFFWKSDYPPIFEWVERSTPTYGEYMNLFSGELDEAELAEKRKVLEDNVLYQFFKAHGYSFKDLQAMPSRTLLNTLKSMPEFGSSDVKRFETYANWLISMGANPENLKKQKSERTIYENGLREAYHWIDKHADGKGVWDSSLIFVEPSGHTNALITKSTNTLLHPFEERTLTQKEKAYLMGIPSDYVVDDFPENVLNQNVPVNTAADMVRHAIKFLKGEAQFSDYFYLMQNNMAKTTEDPMIKSERNFYNASSLF
jgi:site-specific DNA-cytosine methylase